MDEIENIKNALREIMQMIVDRGQPLTPELSSMLSQVVSHAQQRITTLRNAQPMPGQAEQLWVLAGGKPEAFRQYMGNFPNANLNQIAREPGRLGNIEQRLSNQITLPAGEQQAGIPKAGLNSSNIYGFAYSPKDKLLRVRFQGGGIYEYDGVPPSIFKIFQQGAIPARTNGQNKFGRWWVGKKPSLGATFFNMIRDRFPYARVA